MKLRARLAVTAVAVTVPMMAALMWFDHLAQHQTAEERLAGAVYAQLPAMRERCESAPETWGGGPVDPPRPRDDPHGPPRGPMPSRAAPPVVYAYDGAFRSRNARAPVLSAELIASIRGRQVATAPFAWSDRAVTVLLRTPWERGPCAFVLARGTTDPSWGILPDTWLWLMPVLTVFAAVLVAAGPVVRRIRRLTESVERSAASHYEGAVAMSGRDEVAELARAFDAAGHEVRAQLREKDRREEALRHFIANTTHDVMVPLTVLQGHLTTLREASLAGREVDPVALSGAMNEAHYIASLVHNLATTAKLEAAEVRLQPAEVDLCALVERVIARHRPVARQLDVTLECATPRDPLVVEVDATLFEQAVSNVVYNGVRYNRAGGHVAVVLEREAPRGFSLRVIDDGPGIPEASLKTLSERGARGNEARTRAPEGQGLGLHIARRATELHGFRMTLGPSEHGGLEVRFDG